MVNKNVIIAGAIGGIAAIGAGVYMATRSSTTPTGSVGTTGTITTGTIATIAKIILNGPATADIGKGIKVTATAYDQFGNPFPGALLILYDVTTNSNGSMGTTGSNGQAIADVTLPNPGVYTFYAESE